MNTDTSLNVRYVTGVVLANGVEDTHHDILTKEDIKTLFIKYLNHDTDTMHSYIRNDGVDLVANWITEIDRNIQGKIAPKGSWMATFKVVNPEIIKSLDNGNIQGFSLGSVPTDVMTEKYWFLNKPIGDINSFKDLNSVDEAQPVFISFVKNPSNGYGLEIEKENIYINKNKNEVDNMTKNEIKDESISLSGLERLKEIFGINKSTETIEEPVTEPVKPEPVNDDISNSELLEKIPEAVATGITSAFEKMAEGKTEESTPIVEEKPVEEPVKEEEEEEVEETEPVKTVPKIDKQATSKTEPVSTPNMDTGFYNKTGRDAFGCRLKR